ncbi:MAG: hypothetical protein AAFX79_13610 [Planctomycetota bacterium]
MTTTTPPPSTLDQDMSDDEIVEFYAMLVWSRLSERQREDLRRPARLRGYDEPVDFVLALIREQRAEFGSLDAWLEAMPLRTFVVA